MKKEKLLILVSDGGDPYKVEVEGYPFEVDQIKLFVHKTYKGEGWVVTEPVTGLAIFKGIVTRKEAMNLAKKAVEFHKERIIEAIEYETNTRNHLSA
jgi:hypothetical protein